VGDRNRGCGTVFSIKPWEVAYEAAKFTLGGRGQRTMPTSRAFKECAQCFRIVLVDEFRTTMVRAEDGRAMKQVWSRSKQAAIRVLMGCGPANGKFVNHDPNVAQSIRRCLVLTDRLAELCRVAVHMRLQKVVGKVIRCGREKRMWVAIGVAGNPNGLVRAFGCLCAK